MRRVWVKLWTMMLRDTEFMALDETTRYHWLGLILLAGDSPFPGEVKIALDMGYEDAQIAALLNTDVDRLRESIETFTKQGKICREGRIIKIVNWSKYQSEYQRQKPYRLKKKGYSNKKSNEGLLLEGEVEVDKDRDVDIEKNIKVKDVSLETAKVSGSEPSVAFIQFPVVGKGKSEWILTEQKVLEYRESYPGIDVKVESRAARQWCIDNPSRRKTYRGMPAFLSRWFARAQNSGRSGRVTTPKTNDATRKALEKFGIQK